MIGMKPTAMQLIQDYLANRKQPVTLEEVQWDTISIITGIPKDQF